MTKLNATRSSAAARLRGARDTTGQIQEAQALATAHTQAAAAVASLSGSAGPARTFNSVLTQALGAVGSAYASLAEAAAHNNDGAYRSAQAEVIKTNEALRTAFAGLGHLGYRLG